MPITPAYAEASRPIGVLVAEHLYRALGPLDDLAISIAANSLSVELDITQDEIAIRDKYPACNPPTGARSGGQGAAKAERFPVRPLAPGRRVT